jgi:hypothetical protein
MSGGCLRCATYGSAEQQLSAAAAIAARNGAGEDRHVEAVIDKLRSRSKAGQQVLLTNPSPTLAERYRARESELAEVAIHALGEEARAAGEDLSMGFRVSQPRMKKALAAVVDALAKL